MSWQIYYNFSKSVYAPEDYGYVTTSLQNNDSTYIWVSKVWLHFDWMDDKAYPKGCNTQLAPSQQSYIGSFDFQVPSNVMGTRRFKFGVEEQKWTGYAWTSPGLSWSEEKEIKIEPLVKYQAFVSRSIHQVDKHGADPFHCLISNWGFETVTVGLNVFAGPEEKIKEVIKRKIVESDCLIGIATKRFMAQVNGFAWKSFEWLSYEASVADALGKPILILIEKDLVLPSFLTEFPSLTFDSFNIDEGLKKLNDALPTLRKEVERKKSEEFLGNLAKLFVGGLVIAAGIGIGAGITRKLFL